MPARALPTTSRQARPHHQVVDYGDNNAIPSYALAVTYTPVVCGDTMVGPGEQCDDGNTTSGDGCSASCVDESIVVESEPNGAVADAMASTVQIGGDVVVGGAIVRSAISTSTS
jgi:cysteine-rich repeat protein